VVQTIRLRPQGHALEDVDVQFEQQRRRWLANVVLIGELYSKDLLPVGSVRMCVKVLLDNLKARNALCASLGVGIVRIGCTTIQCVLRRDSCLVLGG
jgi:hypothetical protein